MSHLFFYGSMLHSLSLIIFGVKHSLLTMHGSTSAVTHETAAEVVQLWLLLASEEQEEKSVMCLNSSLML